jgi:phenylacetate-CoA ligase
VTVDEDIERAPHEQLRELQFTRLRATVARVLAGAGPLRERLLDSGLEGAGDVASLEDLSRMPFTDKADLREHYPLGLLAVPRERLVRIHASSGTGGKPTIVGYTASDLDVWATVVARCMAMAGVRPGMLLQNANGYGLFTGGLGFHHGAERLGVTVLPVSTGQTERQIMLLRDLRAEALCATPSYAMNIADSLEAAGVDASELALEVGMFGAEPWSEAMREQLEGGLGLKARNFYGLSEIIGPGVSAECAENPGGLHVNEDHFLAEVLDPETCEPLAAGKPGELVITTLTKEALPLIRYRTGDITTLTREPCPCGRTLARMGPVLGRRDDMLILRGVNVYPSEIEDVLLGVEGVAPHYQLRVERPAALDEVTVLCEPSGHWPSREDLRARVREALLQRIGIAFAVELVDPGMLPRSEGKAARVVDLRKGSGSAVL